MTDEKVKRRRKRLGAYYTPLDLSVALSEWSIRSAQERVLEPGFGGCEFLSAAHKRLQDLGTKNAIGQLFGCDIDTQAFAALKDRFGQDQLNGRYLKKDFLSIRPGDYSIRGFDVVLGNPPYVSHHVMSDTQIEAGQLANSESGGADVSRRASLWAYFVTHGVSFLRPGGRSAWVLPGSFLYADYAAAVRDYLSKWFDRVVAFRISERMFTEDQVSEQSIILLCECKRDTDLNPVPIEVAPIEDLPHLRQALRSLSIGKWSGSSFRTGYATTSLTQECRDAIRAIESSVSVTALGSFVDLKIGLVTGANRFFVIRESLAKARNLPARVLTPIITGAEDLIGLSIRSSDLKRARQNDKRCLLLDTSLVQKLPRAVKNYLRTFPPKLRTKNVTFSKRDPWHRINDQRVPDAFFSYMSHRGPKMAINAVQTSSVNAVHRIFKKPSTTDLDLKVLAISTVSTFSQLSAELCGRTYGDGVLKLELSEVRKMSVIRPNGYDVKDITSVFTQMDALRRKGDASGACQLADDFLLRDASADCSAHLRVLKEALEALRAARTRR